RVIGQLRISGEKRTRRAGCAAAPRSQGLFGELWLEDELQPQLDGPGIIGRSDLPEVSGPLIGANAAVLGVADELRMVPDVEELRAELQHAAARFAEYEVLEQGQVPTVTSGTPDVVLGRSPPGI